MIDIIRTESSPLKGMNISFSDYVAQKAREDSAHMTGGIPDYAFALDYELREKLNKIPHFNSLCKKIMATVETRETQYFNQTALAAGPYQYPEIYEMGLDCAKRLGIGVPNIFVYNNTVMNASTYASDITSPMIILNSGIVERMTPGELKCVIAHECGHIHNQHCVYKGVINTILSSGTGVLGTVLSYANIALMQFWTRACEITADRAALICCDDVRDAVNVQAKLLSGGLLGGSMKDQEINIDAFRDQLEKTFSNPARLYEILSDHPSSIRRIFASKEFEECETFYRWRPEMKKPGGIMRSKEETDDRCRKLVNIVNNK